GPAAAASRQTRAGPERLAPGATVRPGDVLQLSVIRGDAAYGWVVSVDGAGAVTLHGGGELAPGRAPLPNAYRLDDAPSFERFFLVTDDEPIARDDVVRAARALAALRDPDAPLVVPGAGVTDRLGVKRGCPCCSSLGGPWPPIRPASRWSRGPTAAGPTAPACASRPPTPWPSPR